jgi:hypothetical protein
MIATPLALSFVLKILKFVPPLLSAFGNDLAPDDGGMGHIADTRSVIEFGHASGKEPTGWGRGGPRHGHAA